MLRRPGARAYLGRDGERMAAAVVGIAVREVVDQLLEADRVLGRQRPLAQEAAHVAVGGGVHVDGEGRHRVGGRREEAVLVDCVVCLGVARFLGPAPRLRRRASRDAGDGTPDSGILPAEHRRGQGRVGGRLGGILFLRELACRGPLIAEREVERQRAPRLDGTGQLGRADADAGCTERDRPRGHRREHVRPGSIGERRQRTTHHENLCVGHRRALAVPDVPDYAAGRRPLTNWGSGRRGEREAQHGDETRHAPGTEPAIGSHQILQLQVMARLGKRSRAAGRRREMREPAVLHTRRVG